LAQEVIQIAKGQLLVNLRFLDRALFELRLKEDDVFTLATDGRTMFYQPLWLLQQYRDTRNFVMRGYLHCLMHCLFRHMFVSLAIDRPLWDLACDIAAEAMVQDLNLLPLQDNGAWVRAETLKTL
jgi:predicted metal-dependent peptidase